MMAKYSSREKALKVMELLRETYVGMPIVMQNIDVSEDVAKEFELDLEKEVDMKTSEEDRIKDLDEINYITGCSLDIEQLVHNEILIHWPMRVLCKEDCKGICSHCGKDLNEGPCSCEQESPDPRMAAIRDIFSKFKEV